MSAQRGFTLIELLVVIAIMGIVGVFSMANFRSFGEDQKLKNSLLDIQSMLRTAQTNAATNTKCANQFEAPWRVEFANTTNTTIINLKCIEPPNTSVIKKTLTFGPDITLDRTISGTGVSCPTELPLRISFAPGSGEISLEGDYCSSLIITLRNNKRATTKSLKIEQGGRIYEQ